MVKSAAECQCRTNYVLIDYENVQGGQSLRPAQSMSIGQSHARLLIDASKYKIACWHFVPSAKHPKNEMHDLHYVTSLDTQRSVI